MLFKTYAPATLSSNCEKARAKKTYNLVKSYANTEKPVKHDYFNYCYDHSSTYMQRKLERMSNEDLEHWTEQRTLEWKDIVNLATSCGQSLRRQYVVYFFILTNGGVKCGETGDMVQRYCDINRENKIETAFYLPLNSKEEAKAAEHALQRIFGHSRGMVQQMNKKDYFDCDHDYAVSFINRNKRKMYDAIMEVKGE